MKKMYVWGVAVLCLLTIWTIAYKEKDINGIYENNTRVITETIEYIEKTSLEENEIEITSDADIISKKTLKGDILERSYDSFRDFPYGNMDYVDDVTYAFLRDTYGSINFHSEIEMGNLAIYNDYVNKFKELLNNQITFVVPETGKEYYVKDSIDMHSFFLTPEDNHNIFNPHGFIYYLFDMDKDGTPELCMYNFKTYIFKYDIKSDSIILWKWIETANEGIHGSLSLRGNWDGLRYTYCELDEKAELTMGVFFLFYAHGEDAFSWLVTVPTYYDEEERIDITYEMKEQAYFCEDSQLYMFNVSEQQFDELTKEYFEASKLSEENIKKVSYTYDELFSDGELCEICRHVNNIWHLSD